jgi:NAD(P)-dependent dehydrogenase (short-subunit alcohol dehydrogenase family)
MTRVAVVTGAASGIGRAAKLLLEARGERVVGVDIHNADVEADLSTVAGRRDLVEGVTEHTSGMIDAIYAVAGLSQPTPPTAAVNYFGMVATLEGLRPLLLGSSAPRAVAVSSMAAVYPVDDELMTAMLAGEEAVAMRRCERLATAGENRGHLIYTTSKRAMSRWVRQHAASAEWAGESISLNAVAPGIVATPMSAPFTATAESSATLLKQFPMPLNGIAEAGAAAELLAWLGSEANAHMCGQILYLDGGGDAIVRGDDVW